MPIDLPSSTEPGGKRLAKSLASSGLRFTRQRQHIYDVLMESHDHPTAEDVFVRAQQSMPEISFATVYNSLSVLVECGLVRQVILDRTCTRFCPNMEEHYHFYCEVCGQVSDIEVSKARTASEFPLPEGFLVSRYDLSLKGTCPKCRSQKASSR